MRFKEFIKRYPNLTESPIAYRGDYNFEMSVTGITDTGINLKYDFKGKIKTRPGVLDVYKFKKENMYIIGEFSPRYDDTEGMYFNVYCQIFINEERIKGKTYHVVSTVKVKDTQQNNGIATELYKFLVKREGLLLISDTEQYWGARRLWAKLSRTLIVDVLDTRSANIIKKNVKIKTEHIDGDFDKSLWSDGDNGDYSKVNIRFILRDL